MKKLLAGLTCVGAAVALLAFTAPQSHATTAPVMRDPAVVINDQGCGMFDGNGGFVLASSDHTVITSSGNGTLKCSVKGVANSTGKAVQYDGLLCGTDAGFTTDSHEVVSASGNATLTCRVH